MMSEDNNDSTTCPVCFELYTETGKHIPRLLPCSHTLCHSCSVTLTKNGKLECPTCRQLHHVKKGKSVFPQNQYILKQLEKKPFEGEFQICQNHKKEKNVYCKERKCQTGICSVCLTENHRRHAVVDFLTVKETVINDVAAELERLSKTLADQKEKLTDLWDKTNNMYNQNLDKINSRRTDFMDSIQPKLDKIEDILERLVNIKKDTSPKMKCRDLSTTTQSIGDLKKESELVVKGSITFTTLDLKEEQTTVNPTGAVRIDITPKKILDLGKNLLSGILSFAVLFIVFSSIAHYKGSQDSEFEQIRDVYISDRHYEISAAKTICSEKLTDAIPTFMKHYTDLLQYQPHYFSVWSGYTTHMEETGFYLRRKHKVNRRLGVWAECSFDKRKCSITMGGNTNASQMSIEMKWILVKHPDNAQSTTVRMRVQYDVSYAFYWLLFERCESAHHFFMQELGNEAEAVQADVNQSKCF